MKLGIPKGEPGGGEGSGGSGAAPPIDDTQASATHPWSGQKTKEELDAVKQTVEDVGEDVEILQDALEETLTEVDDVQEDVAQLQELLNSGNASLAGKILGYDENGNLVPIDPPEAEGSVEAVDDGNGNVVLTAFSGNLTVMDDGTGNIVVLGG